MVDKAVQVAIGSKRPRLLEIYECVTISNDVNRVSVETVGRIKRAFLCLYACRKCDSN